MQNKTDSWWNNLIDGNNYLNKKFKNDEKGIVWLNFIASDGEIETSHPVSYGKNVNRAPIILDYLPGDEVTVPINTPIIFHVTVKDWDKDNLDYSWDFSGWRERELDAEDTIERTFTDLGDKKVSVEIDDGRDEVSKEWLVHVVEGPVKEQPGVVVPTPASEPFTIKVYVIESSGKNNS